jgi:O-antigen ligase
MNEKYLKPLSYLYILLCAVIPWSLAAMQIMLISICIYFIFVSIISKKNLFKYNVFYIFPLAYLASLAISAMLSIDPTVAFDNIFHTYWVILTFPVIASLPLSETHRRQGLHALVISATLVGVYGIFQSLSGSNFLGAAPLGKLGNLYRAIGTYSFYLSFAGNQLMIFAFVFVLAMNKDTTLRKRLFYIASLLIIGLSIVATQGRSTWLGVMLVIFLGTFLFYRKYFWKVTGISFVILLLILFLLPDIADRALAIFSTTHHNNITRINIWQTSLLLIKDHIVIGIGPGLFHKFVELYKVQGFYDSLAHPHNDLLLVMVQSGIIGLITWVLIWLVFFKKSMNYLITSSTISLDVQIVRGAVLAVAGILLASLFQCYFVDLENSILWWVIMGMAFQVLGNKELYSAD